MALKSKRLIRLNSWSEIKNMIQLNVLSGNEEQLVKLETVKRVKMHHIQESDKMVKSCFLKFVCHIV